MTATAITVLDATGHDVAELATLAASAYRETYRTMIDAGVIEAMVAQTYTGEAFTGCSRPPPQVPVIRSWQRNIPASSPFSTSGSKLTVPSCAACTARRDRPAVAWGPR